MRAGPDNPMWKTIVGVVADVHTRGPATELGPEFYLPIAQVPDAVWTWVQLDERRRTIAVW